MKLYALLAGSLLLVCPLFAQESDDLVRGPDRGTEYFVNGVIVLPVAGRPFSARSTTEWTRTLEDGTVVTTHLLTVVARDSQGRIYRQRHTFVPLNSDEQSPLQAIRIFDPVTRTETFCRVATHRCDVRGYHARTSFTPMPPGSFDNGKRSLTRESIGNDVIDGINVVGTRETLTITAGVVGNSQPIVVTREFWYSPDLQINLTINRKDPREGTQTVRLSDVSRAEPDPALFNVPTGFVVQNTAPAKPEN
ncbi:MAG TPA: hypothetical protein VMD99_16850 [Terriglobales bacterium]|nr:hypothetical protein [Terriglobales bacterium]